MYVKHLYFTAAPADGSRADRSAAPRYPGSAPASQMLGPQGQRRHSFAIRFSPCRTISSSGSPMSRPFSATETSWLE